MCQSEKHSLTQSGKTNSAASLSSKGDNHEFWHVSSDKHKNSRQVAGTHVTVHFKNHRTLLHKKKHCCWGQFYLFQIKHDLHVFRFKRDMTIASEDLLTRVVGTWNTTPLLLAERISSLNSFLFLFVFFTGAIVSPSKCGNNVPWAGATIAHMTFLINCRKQWLMKMPPTPLPLYPTTLPACQLTHTFFHSFKPTREDASFHLCDSAWGRIYHVQDTQGTSRDGKLL